MITTLLSLIYDEVRRIWYYRWTFAVTCTVILLASFLYVSRLPNVYDAWAQVLVSKDTPLTAATQAAGLGREDDPSASVGVMEKTLLSDQNLTPVVRAIYPTAASMNRVAMAQAINGLRSRIRISPDQDDGLVEFHYADTNPVRARDVVQGVLNAFISASMNNRRQQLDQAAKFLDQQVTVYQGLLSDSEAKLEAYRKQHPVVTVLPVEPVTSGDIDGAATHPTPAAPAAVSPALAATNERVQALQSQLVNLRTQYTDQYPDVVSVKRQLDDAMAERSREQTLTPSLSSATPAASATHVFRVRHRSRAVAVPPEVGSAWTGLQRDDEVLHVSFQQLVARRDGVRMSLAAYGADGANRFQLLRPPVVPVLPIGPNRGLYVALAAVFAIGAGLAAAYLRGAVSGVFVSPRELEDAFQLPVIGTVSWEPAWDTGETKRSRRRALPTYAGYSLAALLALVALALVANLQDISQFGATIQGGAASALQSITQR
jgi:hypothetical protein